MFGQMRNALFVVGVLSSVASAQPGGKPAPPPPPVLPNVGEALPPSGGPTWPAKLTWMYDVPSPTDAAGKIVVHWFCTPGVSTCNDDLARLVALKENNPRVYIVAYINGYTKRDAQKLDPIRESEGVGRGTVAFGPEVIGWFKKLAVVPPTSIVVDVDGKIALVAKAASPTELDTRDAKIGTLTAAIKEYAASSDGPKTVKAGEKFTLTMKIQLASWLRVSKKPGTSLDFSLTTLPKDIKCDATKLTGDQLKIADQSLTAQVSCSGPHGSYELRGQVNFGYDTPGGASGMGTDGATWKFEIQ